MSFSSNLICINTNANLNIIDIEDIDSSFSTFIDSRIVNIAYGSRNRPILLVKKKICNFMNSKDNRTKRGAIAEFLTHLYLSSKNFKQECLFFNLEENSIKKGFDGYYSIEDEEWIMESKSSYVADGNINHRANIKEAHTDLKGKIKGNTSNNPWENAYNHANHSNVNTKKSIVKNIEFISDNFDNGTFGDIKDYNIIPSSTIFLDDTWINLNQGELITKITNLLTTINYNKIEVVCFTKKSMDLFLDYLGCTN